MKELSIEEKARRYDEAYKKVAVRFGSNVADEIFPELKESEDERVRKDIVFYIAAHHKDDGEKARWLYWLEAQGEHAKFRDSIQVGDKVTRNRDGMLVNLSQLKRVAKPAENKGEHDMGISEATKQKLEDKLHEALEKETPESCNEFLDEQGEHKFPSLSEKEIVCLKRILDFLREEHNSYAGKDFTNEIAVLEWLITHPVLIHSSELQQNQGEQNVLQTPTREMILAVWDLGNIWKELTHGVCSTEYGSTLDYIQKHWKESEYYLRAKQGEQKPVFEMKTPEESLGIDSDTYNKIVDECIYGEQKPAWSEEDEKVLHAIKNALNYEKPRNYLKSRDFEFTDILDWLKSLKDRVQSQTTWKPSEEMLEALYRAIPENVMAISEDEMLLDKLYQGLKYGKVLSEK